MKTTTGLIAALLVVALTAIGATGCNTFKGAGKDIESGGQAVQNAATDTQKDMKHPQTHTITATAKAGGTISPSGSTAVARGADYTYAINAKPGHHVADVLVDGNSVGAVSRYSFENVTAHHTISAVFAADPR